MLRTARIRDVEDTSFAGDTINDLTSLPDASSLLPPRAHGSVRIGVTAKDGTSRLDDLHISGSLKALFPRPNPPTLDAVLLNTAGGVTGGDRFRTEVTARTRARVTLTTQAAERIYKAQADQTGMVETTLRVGDGASLMWLPQETLIFDGASLSRRLHVDLLPTSRFVMCETLLFGRTAMGEVVRRLDLRDRIDLCVEGKLAFADRIHLTGDAQAHLDRPGVAQGATAMASVICHAPGVSAQLPGLRSCLSPTAGGAALTNDLIFFRLVARDGFEMRRVLIPLLRALTETELPRTWML